MELSAIHVYPVKSCAGIAVRAAALDEMGLQHDRRFMVVRPDGVFLTQREQPRLALVRTAFERLGSPDQALRLDRPGAAPLRVPLTPAGGEAIAVTVWSDRVTAQLVSEHADRWLSAHLATAVRLVYIPPSTLRPVDPRYAAGARTGFADGYPLLIVSEASLDELNRHLDRAVTMSRFRPNLVVRGASAFAEDGWRELRIGELVLRIVKPCARCAIVSTDQTTAERSAEPLRTLASFRRRGEGVLFGQNAIHLGTGTLRVGDAVTPLVA